MRRALLLSLMCLAVPARADYPSKRLSDEARGKMLYERHCQQCHGDTGHGDGPAAVDLVAKVPDLQGKLTEQTRDADARVLLSGKGAMPSFDQSFDHYDARRVLRYAQKVSRPGAIGEPAPDEEAELEDEGNEPDEEGNGPEEQE